MRFIRQRPKRCSSADVIFGGVADTKRPAAWKDIAPNLTKGKTLLFSHGFRFISKTIDAAEEDVVMILMKTPKGRVLCAGNTEGKGCR